jgi:uncharacterized protein YdeI (YjbR/CyaY-like superfamily)
VYVEDRAAWRRWLAEHHGSSPGIWLVFDKKASRADRLAYAAAVEEALCYGWIDSLVRRVDDARYVQLFTPRKPTSTWSLLNKDRVARLVEQGLMAEAGLAAIERAKANGTWTTLDAVEALVMPDDLAAALRRTKGAEAGFAAFSRSNRKAYLYWVNQAVRPETRAKRVAEVTRRSAANVRNRHIEAIPKGAGAPRPGTPSNGKKTEKKTGKSGGGRPAKRTAAGRSTSKRTAGSRPRAR